ncbi:MAG TPA: cytochrome c [Psychromonas hadalis]|nr:cytochrome c [Psychromonas hadalis]
MKKHTFIRGLVLGTALFSAAVSAAPFKTADHAIEYRQSAYSMMSVNFGAMAMMAKGRVDWDQAAFTTRANNTAALAMMTGEGFEIKGSEKGKTNAKPVVWSDWDDFAKRTNKLEMDMKNLAMVSAKGDKGATKKAFGQAAQNCKACHKIYRKK